MRTLRKVVVTREFALVLILAAAAIAAGKANARFWLPSNLLDVLRLATETGLIAVGMTAIILTAGIDLSVGSALALCVVVLGKLWERIGLPLPLAAAVAVLVGGAAGALNGAAVTRLGLPPLIVTLATMALYRGLALGISRAEPVHGYPESFLWIGQGVFRVAGVEVPVQLAVFAIVVVIGGVVVGRTVWGRWLYAIGRNETAAELAGVPVRTMKMLAYTATGLLTGIAAVIYVARVSTAKADAGVMLELDIITACVLGGVSISGGEGTVWGTVLGLVIVAVARRGMDLAGVSGALQSVLIGSLLIAAVAAHGAWARFARRAALERGEVYRADV
ncbi:MAG: ABC transporter permease [Armatimonadetes bacterium]|nr:ABC transporter permease [Armatimonadota bacterium]